MVQGVKRMKNLIKSFLFTITFLLIICKPGVASTFATPNIELQGNANGIVFIQGDEPFYGQIICFQGINSREVFY